MPLWIGLISFACEYLNASLGMGYGTTLAPLLILVGYSPALIVPTILLTGFATGIVSGFFHHGFGNISLRRGSRDRGVIATLATTGIAGVVVAVVTAVSLPERTLEAYIGAMVLLMGVLVFVFRNYSLRFSWPRIVGVGAVAAFNKGMSGGGYGPLVVSGQVLSGHGTKNAVGVACLAEGLICGVGFPLYLIADGGWHWFSRHWMFYLPVVLGALLAAPAASWTTKVVARRVNLNVLIALLSCLLGGWTLWKVFAAG